MSVPYWLKPAIFGGVGGAIAVSIIGFVWGGWVTGGSANNMAMTMSRESVVGAMVPVCLDMAQSDMDRAEKIATIKAAAAYQRRDAVMKTGWATMPGTDDPSRDLAQACLESLDIDREVEAAESKLDQG